MRLLRNSQVWIIWSWITAWCRSSQYARWVRTSSNVYCSVITCLMLWLRSTAWNIWSNQRVKFLSCPALQVRIYIRDQNFRDTDLMIILIAHLALYGYSPYCSSKAGLRGKFLLRIRFSECCAVCISKYLLFLIILWNNININQQDSSNLYVLKLKITEWPRRWFIPVLHTLT